MAGETILIVEDDGILAAHLQNTLAGLGYTVLEPVASGKKAIAAVKARQPALILMDINLSREMDGIETTTRIREIWDIPIIYLTGYSQDTVVRKAKVTEPYGYLVKPVSEGELATAMEIALYRHSQDRLLREREASLRDSEEKFRSLAESIQDGIMRYDNQCRLVYVNPAALRMLGLKAQDVIGGTPGECGIEEGISRFQEEKIRSVLDTGEQLHTQFQWYGVKGPLVFDWRLTPEFAEDGSVRSVLGVARDITELKRAEDGLKNQVQFISTLLETIPSPVFYKDSWGMYLGCNRALEELLGRKKEDIVGRTVYDVSTPEIAEKHAAMDMELFRQAGKQTYEHRMRNADGTEREVIFNKASFLDSEGNIAGLVGVILDITERKRDENALRESESRYRLLAENATDVIWIMNLDGRFQYVSPSVYQLRGYTPEEVKKQTLEEVVCESSLQMIRDGMALAVRQSRGEEPVVGALVEVEQPRKDGTTVWTEVSAKLTFDDQGKPIGIQGVTRDITERKRAEAERLEMERRLLHAQKLESLGVLAGGIAHDFNNLLMAVIGNLDMALLDLSPVSSARPSIEQATNAAKRAADLTRQMLAYSGKGRFIAGDLNLNELVEENAHMLRSAISKTVTLKLQRGKDLPSILADASQLQQIVMNLITNASEAIGERAGVVTLSTGMRECDETYLSHSALEEKPAPGRFVWVEVADTGCGMDEATRQRLFDPFFSTKFAGRGLGMSAVLGIVRGHKGAILLESTPLKGTTIRVLFPVSKNGGSTAKCTGGAGPFQAKEQGAPCFSGTILVVDDDEMVRNLCAAMVKRLGFDVLTASDGEEAVSVFQDHADKIAGVILDLTMPRMDGVASFREMRRIRPEVKVVMSSGYSRQEAAKRFGSRGLAGFIQKPYQLTALWQELKRMMEPAE